MVLSGDDSFSRFSVFFDHQELDQNKYPKDAHRRIKVETNDDTDMIPMNTEDRQWTASPDLKVVADGIPKNGSNSAKKAYHKIRVPGGRAAVSRPVSLDMNSDDEIIVSMKRKRISDKKIAEYLKESGRVDYNPKTIGTRFMRIRAKLAAARDEELDKGIATWSAKDDEHLLLAVNGAEKNIGLMKEAAEKAKWDLVSRELLKMDKSSEYSSRACRERFEDLKSGKTVSQTVAAAFDTPAQQEVKRLEKLIKSYVQKLGEAKRGAQQEVEEAFGLPSGSSPGPSNEHGVQENGDLSASTRAMDVDTDLTGLDTWMLRTIRIAEQDAQLEKRLGGINLPNIDDMTGNELAAELQARGLARDGNKTKLLSLVKAARSGSKNLPKSILPADVEPLRAMLNKRASKLAKDDDYEEPAKKRRRTK